MRGAGAIGGAGRRRRYPSAAGPCVRPHYRHQMALLGLADDLGLAHLLTAWTLPDEEENEMSANADRPLS